MASSLPVTVQVVHPIKPSVWCVVTWLDGTVERRTYIDDLALAQAYAAAHRGRLVPLAALVPWPSRPGVNCGVNEGQTSADSGRQ